jgi:hypothetical protein
VAVGRPSAALAGVGDPLSAPVAVAIVATQARIAVADRATRESRPVTPVAAGMRAVVSAEATPVGTEEAPRLTSEMVAETPVAGVGAMEAAETITPVTAAATPVAAAGAMDAETATISRETMPAADAAMRVVAMRVVAAAMPTTTTTRREAVDGGEVAEAMATPLSRT